MVRSERKKKAEIRTPKWDIAHRFGFRPSDIFPISVLRPSDFRPFELS